MESGCGDGGRAADVAHDFWLDLAFFVAYRYVAWRRKWRRRRRLGFAVVCQRCVWCRGAHASTPTPREGRLVSVSPPVVEGSDHREGRAVEAAMMMPKP